MIRIILIGVLVLCFCLAGSGQVVDLSGKWRFHIGDEARWAENSFDDSNWGTIWVPSTWEEQGFNGYDGYAWYRTTFSGRSLNPDRVYYLKLGFIDDVDEVYLNGNLIGFSGQTSPKFKTAYNYERNYVLPVQYLNPNGENVIAVRVFDAMLDGGIVDGRIGIYNISDGIPLLLDLQGVWQFQTTNRRDKWPIEKDWSRIMVPGAWEYQGYYKYDGFGWYKRTFRIPSSLTHDPLILLLGKIDDFDKVYFNGTLIGSTNDRRPYGNSQSYAQTRAYELPQNLIRRGMDNTIEIQVEDMGNYGGIYEGAIGIISKRNYERYFR